MLRFPVGVMAFVVMLTLLPVLVVVRVSRLLLVPMRIYMLLVMPLLLLMLPMVSVVDACVRICVVVVRVCVLRVLQRQQQVSKCVMLSRLTS